MTTSTDATPQAPLQLSAPASAGGAHAPDGSPSPPLKESGKRLTGGGSKARPHSLQTTPQVPNSLCTLPPITKSKDGVAGLLACLKKERGSDQTENKETITDNISVKETGQGAKQDFQKTYSWDRSRNLKAARALASALSHGAGVESEQPLTSTASLPTPRWSPSKTSPKLGDPTRPAAVDSPKLRASQELGPVNEEVDWVAERSSDPTPTMGSLPRRLAPVSSKGRKPGLETHLSDPTILGTASLSDDGSKSSLMMTSRSPKKMVGLAPSAHMASKQPQPPAKTPVGNNPVGGALRRPVPIVSPKTSCDEHGTSAEKPTPSLTAVPARVCSGRKLLSTLPMQKNASLSAVLTTDMTAALADEH